ncbi:MAG: response regulator [Chloroflexi bacterium]|nr:response regulator [Chloroflexota bacterium]
MPKTILVVDDDELICGLVKRFVEQGGYQAITAFNGPSAIAKYETEKPDLVVLDIAMPELSGLEVAKSIRAIQQRDQRPHTPIILLTAYARSFFVSTGDVRVDSYLTKPVVFEQLMEHIRRFIGQAETPPV